MSDDHHINSLCLILPQPSMPSKYDLYMHPFSSIQLMGYVVAAATPSKILAYIQILEPTMDPMINHSLVTHW